MIEQINKTSYTNEIAQNNKIKLQSQMVFSNIALCRTCGMQMEFVEKDVIFGEDWYHGKCWQQMQEGKQNV